MFNVKGTRKKESARLICEALLQISEKKDFDSITISEISNVSTISRNTIYRLFDTKEDILEYLINEHMIEIVRRYDSLVNYDVTDHSYEMIYQSYLTYFQIWEREKHILLVLKKCGKLHYLYDVIGKSVQNNNSEYIIEKIKTGEHFREYYYTWLSGTITSILIHWVKQNCKETPEELTDIILTLSKSVSYNFWHDKEQR